MCYVLELSDIQLWVHLGVSDQERFLPQPVRLDIRLLFEERPSACLSDNLEETICYASLFAYIQKHLQGKTFHLIERLHGWIQDLLEAYLTQYTITVELSITKLRPPLEGIGAVSFRKIP